MKPDRIRREFKRLSDVPIPDDLLERARQRDPTPPRSPGSRAVVAFVALAVFAAAGAFAWSAFRPRSSQPQPPADEGEIPTVVRMDCGKQERGLVTPEVQVQGGGVLIHVEDVGNAVGVEGSLLDDLGSGAWAFDFGETQAAGGFDIALGIAPGAYVVRCADGNFLSRTLTPADGEIVHIVDPAGIWHDFALACPGADQAPIAAIDGGVLSSETSSVVEELIRHAVPGIADSDLIEYAAYPGTPRGEEWDYRVVRGGEVLARLGVFTGDGQSSIVVEACSSSGIGATGASAGTAGESGPIDDPYPRGWFEWCPGGPFLEAGPDWSERASEIAVRFARAYAGGDQATLAEVLDASVPVGAEFRVVLAEGAEPTVGGTSAHGGQIVNYSCGKDVDGHTVAVAIDDGSESASADFSVFLVPREAGWKVWGVY